MEKLNTHVVFPDFVYHGTMLGSLESFQMQLVNPPYWNPAKDFGAGLYITISLDQANKWATKLWEDSPWEFPCVLQIRCLPHLLFEVINPLIFLGVCREWSDFILEHRTRTTPDFDPCDPSHPDIIVGPMADNDTGKVIAEFINKRRDKDWFFDQICLHRENEQKLDGLDLGNQIVFCNRKSAEMLQLIGVHEYRRYKGGWKYYEISDSL